MTSKPPRLRIYWHEQRLLDARPLQPLAHETRTEVVVVGGGMAGLSCAQALNEQGRKVILLERETCGWGASGRSSGIITPDSEMELNDLVRAKGREGGKRLWDFAVSGVDAIRGNIEGHGIDCDMQVQDALFVASSRKGEAVIRKEHASRKDLGYAVKHYDSQTIRSVLGTDGFLGGVRSAGTFGINSYLYCQAMRDVLLQSGVVIHEGSAVAEVGAGRVMTNGCEVRADAVVLCLDRFLPEVGVLSKDVYHAQTFLAVSAPLTDAQVAAIFPEQRLMVWDTDLVYQYFRVIGGNRLLLGAATLLDTYARKERPVAPRVLRKMRAWLGSHFPQVAIDIEYFWPGLIGVSKDVLPLAGGDPAHPGLYLVSGAAGLPFAAALGRYAADKLQSNRSDFEADFDPARRFPVGHFVQGLTGTPVAFALSHALVKSGSA
jgi:gamma-glutamylputrescine oxidase